MDEKGNILDYTLESINEYTIQSAHRLVDLLIDEGIATKKQQDKESKLFIGNMTDKSGLKYCLKNFDMALKSVEKWEIQKNYRYSMLFDYSGFSEDRLQGLIEENYIICYNELEGFEELYPIIQKPSLIKETNSYVLKFNLGLSATDAFDNKLKKRYTILVLFYLNEKMLEIRFDSISAQFSRDKLKLIHGVIVWLEKFLQLDVQAIDLKDIVDYMKKDCQEEQVVLAGQDMLMATGAKATIDIGKSDDQVLPFIGELKDIMCEYEEEFQNAPEIRAALNNFIYEKENLSEFPWVKLKFEEKSIEVKFTFDYGEENGCLIQHFHNALKSNQGRERMDYVTNYVIKVRSIITKLPTEQE
jgi:hypothetical protein|nr:MAG TPA: hypothetical protein [Caudoviricetes sp.]